MHTGGPPSLIFCFAGIFTALNVISGDDKVTYSRKSSLFCAKKKKKKLRAWHHIATRGS